MSTFSIPAAESSRTNDYRRWILMAFYAAAAIAAATDALSNSPWVYLLGTLLLACSSAGWCLLDASWRGQPLTWAAQLLTYLFWPIAVPIYLISSRGWRGLGWALLNALAFYAMSFVAYVAALYLYWGPAAF